MEELQLIPSQEQITPLRGAKGVWGDKLKCSLKFELSDADKEVLLQFHADNAFKPFHYFLKNPKVGVSSLTSLKTREVVTVVALKNGEASMWLNEDVPVTSVDAGTGTYNTDLSLPIEGSIRISQEYVGDGVYFTLTEGGNLLTISVQNSQLVIDLKTADSSTAEAIPVGDIYDGGSLGKVISFSIAFSNEEFVLAHNGITKRITNRGIDPSNSTFQCHQNTYDFSVFDAKLPDEVLKVINKPIDESIQITVSEPEVTLSEQATVFVFGRLGITASFDTKEVVFKDNKTTLTISEV